MSRPSAALLALALAGCGGAPAPVDPPTEADPFGPDAIRLVAPDSMDRWEPSGATVRGDRLWIVNDREGWLAAYGLPLKPGANAPAMAFALTPNPGRIKFEGLAPYGDGGLLILETINRAVWRCPAPDAGCPDLEAVPVTAALDKLEATVPEPAQYTAYEAIASRGEQVWVGSRGYQTADDVFHPWAIITDPQGHMAYDGQPWVVDGRAYGLSDLSRDGDALWMTWSFEAPGGTTDDVSGLLARAELDAQGMPGAPVLCRRLRGKPEGIARYGDQLLVIFDQDADRKDPADPTRFPLRRNEDFVQVLPADCPDGRAKSHD